MDEQHNDNPQYNCDGIHKIGDKVPQIYDLQFDGMTCNCKKFIYFKQKCDCSDTKFDLKSQPNPDYIPS